MIIQLGSFDCVRIAHIPDGQGTTVSPLDFSQFGMSKRNEQFQSME